MDQENPYVAKTLINWISDTLQTYPFDGIRVDTTPEVPNSFWKNYIAAAGISKYNIISILIFYFILFQNND